MRNKNLEKIFELILCIFLALVFYWLVGCSMPAKIISPCERQNTVLKKQVESLQSSLELAVMQRNFWLENYAEIIGDESGHGEIQGQQDDDLKSEEGEM